MKSGIFMKLPLLLLFLLLAPLYAQVEREDKDRPVRLPSGRLQQEEILKAEHEKNIADIAQLIKVAEELQDDMLKNDRHVLSLTSLKKTDEIEKLIKRVRSRLKR
jgi:hypothetical protein